MSLSTLLPQSKSKPRDRRDTEILKFSLESFPNGYSRLAAFIDSDIDLVMYRRFGQLHSRSLLYRQAEITALEEKLASLDRADAQDPQTVWKNHTTISHEDGYMNEERKELMELIDIKLKEYSDILLQDAQLRALSKPTDKHHRSLFNYMWNRKPVNPSEARFINHKDDFVSLVKTEDSWLDDFIHKCMNHCRKGLFRALFVSKEDQAKTQDYFIHYYSHGRLEAVMKTLIAFASTVLLLVPIYLLVKLGMGVTLMTTVVLVFVLIFAAAVSTFTNASRQEVFAATAAYSAVLVTFVANYFDPDSIINGS